ncbi:MAG: deoxynucleoside kinase [Brevefilum fermentans]|jgi:deoxyadenosine/deoxycytidine kinase|uniref:Deoxynucleoside kinase n=1 Tax=Candidatus Brevifilum fermentans TaxID=1986204 RepID=A0A1Y6K7L1_9CHLR|nr:deoxynucleoside kinase [Brevefilum fermentans]SMX54827.1 Deoxynucleoside kinase [Brevefilum fermentans]HOM66505.1 deoxynucleoside kinase [Brevefilum fermentans]
MAKRLVLLAGNIGAGKTSLTERIGEKLGWTTAFESVVDNPYLPDFYQNMQAWSFHLQIYFLGHRADQHLYLSELPQSAILDRSIYEDAHIFARALHHMGNLNDRDYQAYLRLFNLVVERLPKPDLLIYLQAPVPVILQRIRRRARSIEASIDESYLSLLERFYSEWIERFELCPVLTIRSDDLDFVHRSEHLEIVVERIKDLLAGREEMVF